MANDVDAKEIEIIIKSLLISRVTTSTANELLRDLNQDLGFPFNFRKFGFNTFVDYLRSIPSVVELQPYSGVNPVVLPVQSAASRHIDQLVSKQRVPPSKKRGVARRGTYNSRPAPLRRRPTRPMVTRPPPSAVRPDQGVDVRDLEDYMTRNYDRRDLMRNGIRGVDDLLNHVDGMVERGDTKVYPKLAGQSNYSSQSNVIPAGLEDDFDDFDDFDDEVYDEEVGRDSEEEMSKKAIQLWSQALGVEESKSSSRTEVEGSKASGVTLEEKMSESDLDIQKDDTSISSGMINNFRKILSLHPDGIWASQLQQLYYDQFGASLDLLDLNHTSAISLASSLPSVFAYCREGPHDWKLYDARYVTQESLDAQVNGGAISTSENDRYIPQTIIDNIKKLLDKNHHGFRSSQLLTLYAETFNKPLNLEILGFNTLDEFLMILKNDVTLKKVLDYYLLLPKHKLVTQESLQPTKPDERLFVPVESLAVPIPDNVLRLGEDIPLQELPPIVMDPDPTKPLLELEVRVAEVITPAFFYMSLDHMFEELEKMMDDLDKFYKWEEENFKIPLPHIAMNLYCAAKYDGFWHRAKVTRIKNHGDVEIEYIDYGTPGTVKSSELRYLSKEFAYLPAQGICAKLLGVKPADEAKKFPIEVSSKFLSLVSGKRLVAHVYQVAERVRLRKERMQLEVILFDVENPKQEIVINDYLVENGLASSVYQARDDSLVLEQPAEEQPTEDYLIPPQTDVSMPPLPLPESSASLPDNSSPLLGNVSSPLPTSSVVNLLKNLLNDLSSPSASPTPSPRTSSTSLPRNKKPNEGSKPRRPPPGFEEMSNIHEYNVPTPPPVKTQPVNQNSNQKSSEFFHSLTPDQQKIMVNNYYCVMPPTQQGALSWELYAQLMLQEQCRQQNMFQANLSNMPLEGNPIFQNGSQRSLTYSSVVPPPNAYHPNPNMYRQQAYCSAHPNAYIQMNPVPVIAPPGYVVMNPPVPVPGQYYQMIPKVPGLSDVMVVRPPSQSFRQQPSPVTAHHSPSPTLRRPASSSSCASTSVPERPLKNPTPTEAPAGIRNEHRPASVSSRAPESCEASRLPSRPGTPLTPASAEVANICKNGSPISLASNQKRADTSSSEIPNFKSGDLKESSLRTKNETNLVNNPSIENILSELQFNIKSLEKPASELQNFCSNDQSVGAKHNFISISNPLLDVNRGPALKVNEVPLPTDTDLKISPSSEKLFSAVSSPVDSLIHTSPVKEESSDDYVSAPENVEETRQKLTNMTLTEQNPLLLPRPACEDIPDSWENLDLDDTPAKAENFSVDFSQPLDLIIKNIENEKRVNDLVENPPLTVKSQDSILRIEAPVNWKDTFNPDTFGELERINKNNKVKDKSHSSLKFNVKKVPVQEVECQGKLFHLLWLNETPAVVALEFFKQFSPHNTPAVSEKVVEVQNNKMYFISKAEFPDVLNELNKVKEFHGGVDKKTVIRLNKVRVLNFPDIPLCLSVLNVPNKPLLDDLKKIAEELETS